MVKTYESGSPCKKGHPGRRYINGNRCADCTEERARKWTALNKERRKEIVYKSDRKNQSKRNFNESKRRAVTKLATPVWLSEEDKKKILDIYEYSRELGYHVDHIVPLRGKKVCGLNVPWNLQVLPPEENIRKHNFHEV